MSRILYILLSMLSLWVNASDEKKVIDSPKLIEFGGYLMLDHDYYAPFYAKSTDYYQHKTEIRRSKFGITVRPNQYIKSKLQIKYSRLFPNSGKLILGDAYIQFNNKMNTSVQIGHMKEPFGLEQQTSSSELAAIERSLPTSVFTPRRNFGLLIDYKKKSYTLAGGYFIDNDNNDDFSFNNFNLTHRGKEDTQALTMRFTIAPIRKNNRTFHLGSSVSKRWLNGEKIQYKTKGEVHSADTIIRSARFYAEESILYQMDVALHNNNFLLQGELFSNSIQQVDGDNWFFSGAYIQASYKMFGKYKYKLGKFKSSKPDNTMALEWVLRHSYINLLDHNIGSKASSSLIGIRLYLTRYFKFMLNINTPWITGDTVNKSQSGQAYSLRAQLSF